MMRHVRFVSTSPKRSIRCARRNVFILKDIGISGNLLNLFQDYLLNRYQRVVLNAKESHWSTLQACVPQGSVLELLLFLIYINDLTDNISFDMRLFADDSSLFTCQWPYRNSGDFKNSLLQMVHVDDFVSIVVLAVASRVEESF